MPDVGGYKIKISCLLENFSEQHLWMLCESKSNVRCPLVTADDTKSFFLCCGMLFVPSRNVDIGSEGDISAWLSSC